MKKSKHRKILVTGGMGFIGSNFIRYLLTAYPMVRIVNLDKLTYAATRKTLRDVENNPRYCLVRGDICDAATVGAAMQGCGTVVNFAAESHVDRSIVSAHAFIKTNIDGVRVLMDSARRQGVTRFLHISTDEVYGSRPKGSFRETDPLEPNSPYAASKAAADLLVRSYVVTYGLPALITRSSNNFGPYQFPEKVIPLFITNILAGKPVPLYGDGRNIRDWLFVEDNCRAIDLVLQKGVCGEIYNIGAGNELMNIDLTRRILALLGKDESWITPVADRLGHDRRYSIATAKIRSLGFRPRRDFARALAYTIAWYRDNRSWWKPLKKRS